MAYYTCKRCGTELFDRDAVTHEGVVGSKSDGVGVSEAKESWGKISNQGGGSVGGQCTSVFLTEQPAWAEALDGNSGRLDCPKCNARVGSFSWSGAPCSCGKWVTPAFQFQLARIDPKGLLEIAGITTGYSKLR